MEFHKGGDVPPELPPYETKFYTGRTPVVKYNEMPERIKKEVFQFTHRALAKYYDESDIATYIKTSLERAYPGGMWQVTVGRNMAVSAYYEVGKYIYFYIGQTGFVIYRTGAL